MDLKMGDDELKKLVSGAIFQHLTADDKESILSKAIEDALFKREQTTYGQRPSMLEEVFKAELGKVAHVVIRDMLEKDERIMAQVRDCLQEVVERVFFDQQGRDAIITKMANKLGDAFDKVAY